MSFRYQWVLGVAMAFSGCVGAVGKDGTGVSAANAPTLPPAPSGEATMGGNRVRFEVDGQEYAFRTPEVRHSRARVAEHVVAQSFELANADNSLYARLVLNVTDDRINLSGEYAAVALDDQAQRERPGVGEVVLAEETDATRGRRMLPSGSGVIVVEHVHGRLKVRFSTGGDGLFRKADASPVTGTLDFHWRP
ncbi:hypothetical protein [Arenimonas donghaensis]|uniref:Uncharacterized protein n=1 Tax=Arenimonas donghaensis DSM 18148 = HO3-R19 TaxID=1121014 RepID=A0A087MLJ5_9GAMM|nr:hypothetical protein [Arenimonas donghaensis]KFL37748.1 hypothetical protein N788_00840 [Arenimonas donghaensis DSM 18148 = HO3-R19]